MLIAGKYQTLFDTEILSSTIIIVGDFNPSIFSPDWLEKNSLLGEDDAASAREDTNKTKMLLSHQVAVFETDWFSLQVVENKFTLKSKGVLTPSFKDLAVGIFQLLSHTPVKAIGLNFVGYFKFGSQEQLYKLGDLFAPKDIWNKLYSDSYAGLEQLTIRFQRGARGNPAETKDERRITLERNNTFKHGIALLLNEHYDISKDDEGTHTPAERVATIIDEKWESSWHDSESIFDQVLTMAMEEEK